jgi:hypothetical protein
MTGATMDSAPHSIFDTSQTVEELMRDWMIRFRVSAMKKGIQSI